MIEGHGGWRVMSVQSKTVFRLWTRTGAWRFTFHHLYCLLPEWSAQAHAMSPAWAAGVIIVPPCLIYFIGWMIWKIEKMEWTFVYLTFYPRILFTIKIARVWKKEKEVALWLWVTSMEMRRIWFWFYLILVELWICPAVMCPIWSMNMNISD